MTAYELTGGEKVMALSLNEPFGSLIVNHGKQETRRRSTNVRGWILICSCLRPYSDGVVRIISGQHQHERIFQRVRPSQYVNGQVLGIAYLKDCRTMVPLTEDENRTFVKYDVGLFLWMFKDVFPIVPVPWKGKQGWKKVDDGTLKTLIIKR